MNKVDGRGSRSRMAAGDGAKVFTGLTEGARNGERKRCGSERRLCDHDPAHEKLTTSLANPCCSSEINKAILEMWNEIVSVICNNNFNGGNKKSRKTTQTSSSYLPASELNEMFTLLIEFSWYTSR